MGIHRPRSGRIVALAASSALVLGACTSDAGWSGTDPGSNAVTTTAAGSVSGAQWDLVLTAAEARVVDPAGDRDAVLLRLDRPGTVEAFTDRPRRGAGSLTVPGLVDLWGRGAFGQDPPNAVVVLGGQLYPVELAAAAAAGGGDTVVIELRPLVGPDGRATELPREGRHRDPVLFIDAVTIDPQVTDAITQTNVKVVGESPAESLGALYQSIGNSTGVLGADAAPPSTGSGGPIGVGADGDTPPPGISPKIWALLTSE